MAHNPPKRICICWPSLGPYHWARVLEAHRQCSAEGFEFHVLETAAKDALYAWDRSAGDRYPYHHVAFENEVFESIGAHEMHAGIIRMLDDVRPDVVIVNSYSFPDARACLWWARKNGVATVLMTDSKADDAPRKAWKESLKSLIVRQFDAAFLAGSPQKDYFSSLGFPVDRMTFGCDVVDNAFFTSNAKRIRTSSVEPSSLPGLAEPAPFMLASSRFIARKNLAMLLDAYARYRDRTPEPLRLVILGDGPLRGALEQQMRDHAIEGVTLAGKCAFEALPEYYSRARLFVHPALQDTWALVVNEAMASGLPVLVSTGAGCHRDLVEPGINGACFDPRDPESLAGLMVEFGHDQEKLSQAGHESQRIISGWSLQTWAESAVRAAGMASSQPNRRLNPVVDLLIRFLARKGGKVTGHHDVEA